MIFTYKAVDKDGKQISGTIEADNNIAVIAKIKEKGLFPMHISQESAKKEILSSQTPKRQPGGRLSQPLFTGRRIRQKDIVLFTRQLSTLIASGLPLAKSLSVLKNQQRPGRLKDTIGNLLQQVESGNSFSEALSRNPEVFPALYVNSIKAGEIGGVLEIILARLADFGEKNLKLANRIKAALVYPSLVIIIAVSVLFFIVTFIVPKFIEMFTELKVPLPLPTRILVSISGFSRDRWWIIILALIGLVLVYKILVRFSKIRYIVDVIKLKIPVFGILIQKLAITRFSRIFGTLLSSGVGILQSLLVAKDMVGNMVISRSIDVVHASVREGQSVAKPLKNIPIFPPMIVNMIEVGEETGALDRMLLKVADIYDDEIDTMIATLTSLLEPFLLVFMGFIVGSIVISMFLPLISLLSALGTA